MYRGLVRRRNVTRDHRRCRGHVWLDHDRWNFCSAISAYTMLGWVGAVRRTGLTEVLHPRLLSLRDVPPAVQDHEQERLDAVEVDEIGDKLVGLRPYDQVLQPIVR